MVDQKAGAVLLLHGASLNYPSLLHRLLHNGLRRQRLVLDEFLSLKEVEPVVAKKRP